MDKNYIIPAQTRIGHVHLKVSDLQRSLEFYRDLLGFEVTTMYGKIRQRLFRQEVIIITLV